MNDSKPKPNPNSPPSKPQTPQQHHALNPMEERMTLQTLQMLQLERTMWLMAHEAGGAMVVDEASLNPLWNVKFERVKGDNPTLLKITADSLQEPTDSQIQRLADSLANQPEEFTPSALMMVGMSNYPASYVVARLAPLVVCRDGKWHRA